MADSFNVVSARSSVTSRPELGQIDVAELGHIRSGQSAYDEGVGFWLGRILGVAKFSLGDSAGDKMTWDGNSLDITGTLTATTGVIGGFTIGATTLTATNFILDSSGQRLSLGSGNNIVILDADDATYRLWVGNSTAASAPFRVEADGSLVATDATITGSITASTGTIGGFTIGATTLTGSNLILDSSGQRITLGTSNSVVILDADDATYRLWIGNATAASAPFRVTSAGAVTATSGTIGGFTLGSTTLTATNLTLDASGQRISLGSTNSIVIMDADDATYRLWVGNATAASAPFRVTSGGALTATSATITGSITSTSGTIGGFTLGSSTLTATNLVLDSSGQRISLGSANNIVILDADDATYRLWIGNATAASAPFRVEADGSLIATDATITGAITATSGSFTGSITASSGTIGGFSIGASTLTATNLILDSSGQRISLGSSNDIIILDADDATYRLWIGHATAASAPFSVTKAGAATATNITITGGSVLANLLSGLILQANLDISNAGWSQTSAFSVTDSDTVAWGAGTFTAANGTAYSIGASNTGNMVAKTYIYFQPSVSTTAYQTTTTASTAVGAGKVLVAIAQNNTTEATFQVVSGQGGQNIDASSIVAGSITANEIAASTITAGKLSVATLSAITADMGSITAGTIALTTSGHIRSGQTAYNTGVGFWLGIDGVTPKFSIGAGPAELFPSYLAWDGSNVTLTGDILAPGILDIGTYAGTQSIRLYAGGNNSISLNSSSDNGVSTTEFVVDQAGGGAYLTGTDADFIVSGNLAIGGLDVTALGARQLLIHGDNAGASTMVSIYNSSDTADSTAWINLTTNSATSSNPYIAFNIGISGSITGWNIGVDNSDSDKFKIANGNDLAGNPKIIFHKGVATAGDVDITTNLVVGGYYNDTTLTVTQGTITDPSTALSITSTWNDAADTFDAFTLNVTNAASAAASRLLRLQVGGGDILALTRAGVMTLTGTLNTTGAVDFDSTLNVDGAVNLNSTLVVGGNVNPTGAERVLIADGGLTLTLGADASATTLTDATQKVARVGIPHYTNSEENTAFVVLSSNDISSGIDYGGGTSLYNAVTRHRFYTASTTTTTTGTSRMEIDSAGAVYIGDNSNAGSLIGLTINQGSADDAILTFKSSDVAHGYTSAIETDSYGSMQKISATIGGLYILGYCESTNPQALRLEGRGATPATAAATSARGFVEVFGQQMSGTTVADSTANAIIFTIGTRVAGAARTVLCVDEDGDLFLDGVAGAAFDEWDDIALLEEFEAQRAPTKVTGRTKQGKYTKADLVRAKLMSDPKDGGEPMYNSSQLQHLQSGALRQLEKRIAELEKKLQG